MLSRAITRVARRPRSAFGTCRRRRVAQRGRHEQRELGRDRRAADSQALSDHDSQRERAVPSSHPSRSAPMNRSPPSGPASNSGDAAPASNGKFHEWRVNSPVGPERLARRPCSRPTPMYAASASAIGCSPPVSGARSTRSRPQRTRRPTRSLRGGRYVGASPVPHPDRCGIRSTSAVPSSWWESTVTQSDDPVDCGLTAIMSHPMASTRKMPAVHQTRRRRTGQPPRATYRERTARLHVALRARSADAAVPPLFRDGRRHRVSPRRRVHDDRRQLPRARPDPRRHHVLRRALPDVLRLGQPPAGCVVRLAAIRRVVAVHAGAPARALVARPQPLAGRVARAGGAGVRRHHR